jgi:predicted RNA-binding protein with PIN domain
MPYLIDGHNLIPKIGLQLDDPNDEMELVTILQEFLRLSRREAAVYFDAAPPGEAPIKRFGRVTAHFVPLGTTADSAIKLRLRKLAGAARNWIIVSSDREVQDAAHAAHARTLSSDEFANQLKTAGKGEGGGRSALRTVEDEALPPGEIDEWLRLFDKHK